MQLSSKLKECCKSSNVFHMSRGFVKEDDQEEIPMVPPRADLPEGVTNYVTQAGMNELLAEKKKLDNEKNMLDSSNETENRIARNYLNAKLQLLNNRIAEARIVDLSQQTPDEVKFGAQVTLKIEASNKIQSLQIVGVDEADISRGKISFTSPLSRILINKKVGDRAVLERVKDSVVFEIMGISYG